MARYFRCGEPTLQCDYARTQEIVVERDGVCPLGKPDCAAHRQPVAWRVAIRELHPTGFKVAAGMGIASLLLLLLVLALGPGGWQDRYEALNAEVVALNQRLLDIEASPQPPVQNPAVALAQSEKLREQAVRLSAEIDRSVNANEAAKAKQLLDELETVARQSADMAAAGGWSDAGAVQRSLAIQLAHDYERLEEQAETDLSDLTARADEGGIEAFSALIKQIRDDLGQAQKFVGPPPAQGQAAELARIQQQIEALVVDAKQRITASLPALPFTPTDAGLVIAASPGLAEVLILPLLQARWNGAVTPDPNGHRWLLASSAAEVAPGVLVMTTDVDPYADLFKGSADLVITDQPIDAGIRARFAKAFPGTAIDSRTYSEIIALNAVALLGHPGKADSTVGPAHLTGSRWVVANRDIANVRRVSPVAISTTPVDDPLAVVLNASSAQVVALYHQCGPNLRASYLAYQPAPEARALAPSPFSIGTEDYGLSYRITATHSPRARPAAQRFIEYVTSDQGQDQVAKSGFVDLRLRHREEAIDPLVLATLGEALGLKDLKGARASRYSTNLRFALDKDQLDIKAQADINRLARVLARDFPTGKMVILGFTDDTGTAEHNHGLSVRRAKHIATMLKTFDIPAVAAGLGQQLPVDSNATEKGRARNRRAEVWVVQP